MKKQASKQKDSVAIRARKAERRRIQAEQLRQAKLQAQK